MFHLSHINLTGTALDPIHVGQWSQLIPVLGSNEMLIHMEIPIHITAKKMIINVLNHSRFHTFWIWDFSIHPSVSWIVQQWHERSWEFVNLSPLDVSCPYPRQIPWWPGNRRESFKIDWFFFLLKTALLVVSCGIILSQGVQCSMGPVSC